jgi:hypothetical protein
LFFASIKSQEVCQAWASAKGLWRGEIKNTGKSAN